MSTPQKIGRYRILRRIGAGAFATVWLGADDALEALVAIKVLADNWAHHPDVRERFEQEARIMRRVDSPRLVRILDIDELPDGRPYLVMPYATGGTLADRLIEGPLPVHHALVVATEIARAAADLHEAGVLHRDLKPSNVLLDGVAGNERVLVTDLGLAKTIAHASGFTVIAGTPGYMAPEQAKLGAGLNERCDVYAIGALLHHMLTGEIPATSEGGGAPVRPSKLRPGIPSVVDDVVVRARQADPAKRWPTAAALADALQSLTDPEPVHDRRRSRRLRVVASVATAVLAAAAAGGVLFVRAERGATVSVSDVTGTLSVAVPADWAGQLRDAGWDPGALRLPTGHAPGLVVAPNLSTWSDPGRAVPGVFVGASRSLGTDGPAPALPDHANCVRAADRTLTVAGAAADVRRWTGCGGTSIAYDEVLFALVQRGFGVYVQIRQVDGRDRTDSILASLRVSDAPTPQAVGVRPVPEPGLLEAGLGARLQGQ